MGLFFTSIEEFSLSEPLEWTSENFPKKVAKVGLIEVGWGGRRLKVGGTKNGEGLARDWK